MTRINTLDGVTFIVQEAIDQIDDFLRTGAEFIFVTPHVATTQTRIRASVIAWYVTD